MADLKGTLTDSDDENYQPKKRDLKAEKKEKKQENED